MPTSLQCSKDFSLLSAEVAQLWQETVRFRRFSDDQVNIRCVDVQEITRLNEHYRSTKGPTNVLTFSYSGDTGEHDIALCVPVAEQEAVARRVSIRDYIALLLVHAFLHTTGLDHEESESTAQEMREAEAAILRAAGFKSASLEGGV